MDSLQLTMEQKAAVCAYLETFKMQDDICQKECFKSFAQAFKAKYPTYRNPGAIRANTGDLFVLT